MIITILMITLILTCVDLTFGRRNVRTIISDEVNEAIDFNIYLKTLNQKLVTY